VSSETSATKSQTPGNYPKRNKLHLQHGESLRTRLNVGPFSYNGVDGHGEDSGELVGEPFSGSCALTKILHSQYEVHVQR